MSGCGCGCGCDGGCERYSGVLWGLLGALMLFNLLIWPRWLGIDGWLGFFALLLLASGIWKSFMVGCKCGGKDKAVEAPKEVHVEHVAPAPVHKGAKKK